MEGRKRQIPDDDSDAANKKPACGRRRIAHEASTRRPESALLKDQKPAAVPTAGGSQAVRPSRNVPKRPTPSVVPTAGGRQAVRPSQNVPQFKTKFRLFMCKWRWLHDRNHVNSKDKALVEKSWNDVSSACKMSVAESIELMRRVQVKYRRLRRLSAEKGSLPAPDMRFINDWKFLRYQRRTTTQNTTPTVSSTANQTQSLSTPRGVVPRRLSSSNSGIRMNKPTLDQSFADDLAVAMQDFSARQKDQFKYGCLKLAVNMHFKTPQRLEYPSQE